LAANISINTGTNAYIDSVPQTGRYVFSVSNGVNTDVCCQTSDAPVFSGAPTDLYFEIASINDVPSFTGTVTATAECTSPATSVVSPTIFSVFGCPVRRTWSYTDDCNKNTQVTQTFHYPEVFTEEFEMTVPADYYMAGSCGSATAPNPSVSGNPTSNRGTNANFHYSDSAFAVVDGVCSMDRFWIGEDICEVTKLGRQRIIIGVPPSLTTAAITTGPLMPPLISVPQYCSQFPIAEGAQAYYCSADHSQYYACMTGAFNSQSTAFSCPATLYCNCAPGVECSQGGLVSPCDYPPSP